MNTKTLLNKLKGVHTIKSIMALLGVNRQKAVYYIYKLRKNNYVKTKRLSDKTKVYSISFENRFNAESYEEILNRHSPVKITTSKIYKIHKKNITLEETLIYALKTQSLRTILASLALFKKIKNWKLLYHLAKKDNIERQIGALYDLARKIMRTRRMSKTFRNHSLPKKHCKFIYVIQGLKSKDFKDIEGTWKIYLPFNKEDLEDYK